MLKAIILMGIVWGLSGIEGVPLGKFETMSACEAAMSEVTLNLETVEPGTALGVACVEMQALGTK